MSTTSNTKVDDKLLKEVVRRILSVETPLKIVLFGSHGRGNARPTSDLDLLIVEERSDLSRYKRATPYRMALLNVDLDADIDIVVWTRDEIAEWANVQLAFITTILREGKVLYEDGS